jgi:hypothetical protein
MPSIINASSSGSGGIVQTADASGVLQLQSNGTTALSTSGANLTAGGVVSFQGTTIPAAGTASIFNRSSDSTMYLQAATGGGINLLDGSQNSMATFAPTSVQLLTGNVARMTINSSGYATQPFQPMFVASGNQNSYVSVANGANLPLNTTKFNTSSSYNTSTYFFTAPVSGRYLFIVAMYMQGGASSALFDFEINSGTYQRMSFAIPAGDLTYFGQCIMNMSAGDTARVKNSTGSARSMFIASDLHSAFSGYLIG